MTKVEFIKELQPGEMIILPAASRQPLRFTAAAMLGRFADRANPERRSRKLRRALTALRHQGRRH